MKRIILILVVIAVGGVILLMTIFKVRLRGRQHNINNYIL